MANLAVKQSKSEVGKELKMEASVAVPVQAWEVKDKRERVLRILGSSFVLQGPGRKDQEPLLVAGRKMDRMFHMYQVWVELEVDGQIV